MATQLHGRRELLCSAVPLPSQTKFASGGWADIATRPSPSDMGAELTAAWVAAKESLQREFFAQRLVHRAQVAAKSVAEELKKSKVSLRPCEPACLHCVLAMAGNELSQLVCQAHGNNLRLMLLCWLLLWQSPTVGRKWRRSYDLHVQMPQLVGTSHMVSSSSLASRVEM